ncbi:MULTISPECIES: iron ABC transporter permease [unclassified Microbacterium]|uniref:ABC transporter permease n=1 Tax=unclassified Microbacterium TaxID=2609290 RepID=UPI00214AEDE3|nr:MULTISPECIES: iron ABC transporter permease [unclassified Microbacterium]MCR2811391.1 iron ABC transporter permease [Microbacterium sp. zg.B185]WIM19563.1 iron ABC transporter permease [Microbacterium sp. zg-B185]
MSRTTLSARNRRPAPKLEDVGTSTIPLRARSAPNRRGGSISWYVFAITVAVLVLAPLLIYHAQAFTDGAAGIRELGNVRDLGGIIINTVLIAAGSTLIATVLAIVLAKALVHVPRRMQAFASIIPILTLVAPPVALVTGWGFLFSPKIGYGNVLLRELPWLSGATEGPLNVYSMLGIIIVSGLDITGVVFLLVSTRIMEIRGPLESAAKIAGANAFQSFMTITLPLLRPSIIAGAVVAFLMGLGQFTAPLFLGTRHGIDTITTTIFQIREQFPVDYGLTAALGLPLLLLGIVAVIAQRTAIGDQRRYITQTGGSGATTDRTSWWAFTVIALFGVVAVALPLGAVTVVAFSPFWSGDLLATQFTLTHFESILNNSAVQQSIVVTLVTSVLAVLIALPIGFFAALGIAGPIRAPRFVQYIIDFSFQAPLAVPRAVLGLAILYVLIRPPFQLFGTIWMFVIGYVFIVLPFILRSLHGSFLGLSPSLFEAARISGAGYFRTVLDIAFPLVRRGMAAGAALALVLLSHDFAVSVMVRAPSSQVMGTMLFHFWDGGIFPEVAVMSLLIAVVTSAVLVLTMLIGGRSALRNL